MVLVHVTIDRAWKSVIGEEGRGAADVAVVKIPPQFAPDIPTAELCYFPDQPTLSLPRDQTGSRIQNKNPGRLPSLTLRTLDSTEGDGKRPRTPEKPVRPLVLLPSASGELLRGRANAKEQKAVLKGK